jgi:hypothetical protein
VKNFRKEIGDSLNRIENRVLSIANQEVTTSKNENLQLVGEIKKIGDEMERLKYQTSDDINDCVKYISTINDKLNHIAIVTENQQNYNE